MIGVEERDRVGFASRKEVSVAVDRDRDGGVSHELADFVDRDSGVEHLRDRCVAALLEPDRPDPLCRGCCVQEVFSLARSGPCFTGTLGDGVALERLARCAPKDEVGAFAPGVFDVFREESL